MKIRPSVLLREYKVTKWARAWKNRADFDFDDLTQSGYIALCEAVKGYQAGRGMSFLNYLMYFLKREFSRVAGCYTPAQAKEPLNNAYSLDAPASANPEDDTTLGDTLPVEEAGYLAVEESLYNVYVSNVVREAINSLPEKQRVTIEEHYLQGKSFTEIGKGLCVSSTSVCNYAKEGIRSIRRGKHAPTLSALLWGERNLYKHTGFTAWRESGYSVQEWNVFWKDSEISKHNLNGSRIAQIRYCVRVLGMEREKAELLFS